MPRYSCTQANQICRGCALPLPDPVLDLYLFGHSDVSGSSGSAELLFGQETGEVSNKPARGQYLSDVPRTSVKHSVMHVNRISHTALSNALFYLACMKYAVTDFLLKRPSNVSTDKPDVMEVAHL